MSLANYKFRNARILRFTIRRKIVTYIHFILDKFCQNLFHAIGCKNALHKQNRQEFDLCSMFASDIPVVVMPVAIVFCPF